MAKSLEKRSTEMVAQVAELTERRSLIQCEYSVEETQEVIAEDFPLAVAKEYWDSCLHLALIPTKKQKQQQQDSATCSDSHVQK